MRPSPSLATALGRLPSLLAAVGLAVGVAAAPPARAMELGTNLGDLREYASAWPFVDAFKTSRAWISGSEEAWDDGRPLDLDERGWVRSLAPGQIARTLMFWDLPPGHFPSGRYLVLYEGQGTLLYAAGARLLAAESRPGRHVLDVDARRGGIRLEILATDPADPIRDIRVLMPGGSCSEEPARGCDPETPCPTGTCRPFEATHRTRIFHPHFLASLAPHRVLRFMDWMRTNDAEPLAWAERPRSEDARWTTKGAPLEVMLELARAAGADPWLTVSHRADDATVQGLAALAAERLPPGRRVWVEHSNEVWNQQFQQAGHAIRRGEALGLGEGFPAGLRYHALRSTQVFAAFRRALGRERVVAVLGAQSTNPWTTEQMLAFRDTAAHTDALAIGPYFGRRLGLLEETDRVAALTLDALFAELRERDLPELEEHVRAHLRLAAPHGIEVVAYEGGQHLVSHPRNHDHAGIQALFDAANRDPRMGALYTDYLARLEGAGLARFVHFTHCGRFDRWGRWGSMEYLGQPLSRAPKYRALIRHAGGSQGPERVPRPPSLSAPGG